MNPELINLISNVRSEVSLKLATIPDIDTALGYASRHQLPPEDNDAGHWAKYVDVLPVTITKPKRIPIEDESLVYFLHPVKISKRPPLGKTWK